MRLIKKIKKGLKIHMTENKDKLQFCLLKGDAMLPEKNDEDAGYDIYACFSDPWMVLLPHQTVMIPTGIASVFDKKYVAVLKERGSTGTKGMGQRSGIIDSGYRGEWLVPITNHNYYPIAIVKEDEMENFKAAAESNKYYELDDFLIYPYNKAICQALILPVPEMEVEQITKEELEAAESKRGAGKLGSSGK